MVGPISQHFGVAEARAGVRTVGPGAGIAVGQYRAHAPAEHHAAQGHDKGRNIQLRHAKAVHRAHTHAHQNRDENGTPQGPAAHPHQIRADEGIADQAGAHAKISAAGDHREGDANGQQQRVIHVIADIRQRGISAKRGAGRVEKNVQQNQHCHEQQPLKGIGADKRISGRFFISLCFHMLPLSPPSSVPAAAAGNIGDHRENQNQRRQRVLEGDAQAHG